MKLVLRFFVATSALACMLSAYAYSNYLLNGKILEGTLYTSKGNQRLILEIPENDSSIGRHFDGRWGLKSCSGQVMQEGPLKFGMMDDNRMSVELFAANQPCKPLMKIRFLACNLIKNRCVTFDEKTPEIGECVMWEKSDCGPFACAKKMVLRLDCYPYSPRNNYHREDPYSDEFTGSLSEWNEPMLPYNQ